jgi:hypothetical protein
VFKVGQKVMIRPDFTKEDCTGVGYRPSMDKYRGKIMTIEGVHHSAREDGFTYYYTEEHKGLAFHEKQLMIPFRDEEEAFEALVKETITTKQYTDMLNTLSK